MLVKPIERRTPTSFDCSTRFEDMLVDSAKKHRNITIKIMTENIAFNRAEQVLASGAPYS